MTQTRNAAVDEPKAPAKKPRVPWTPEGESMALACTNAALPALWMLLTYLRWIAGDEVATPRWWLTAAITIAIPGVIFLWSMRALARSVLVSVNKESAGSTDQKVSQISVMVIVVTCAISGLLWALGHLPLGPNHALGLATYLILGFVEMQMTTDLWTVANRRPGGTIGYQ